MNNQQKIASLTSSSTEQKGMDTFGDVLSLQLTAPDPARDDRDAWRAYWPARGQAWRTEPEIDAERQKELDQYRAIVPHIDKGIFPFCKVKLSRADVEWLLATHEDGRGPVDWADESKRDRPGLDLRGADLREVDLSALPLAHLRGGSNPDEIATATLEQRRMAALLLRGAKLNGTHLERSALGMVDLREANLRDAHLEEAHLYRARLESAYLYDTHLEGTSLRNASFDSTTTFHNVALGSKHLRPALLANVNWGGMNLLQVDWAEIKIVGDEYEAQQERRMDGQVKERSERLEDYRTAVQANRQLMVTLQTQGLNEDAARFAYRAQVLQRRVSWYQMMRSDIHVRQRMQIAGVWLFSWFLYLIAGYGYKPSRSFLSYFLVIIGFSTAYYSLGRTTGPVLSLVGAFVLSMTSFHGRGFFPGHIPLDDPMTVLAAFEALVGLIIEVTFIATLTQRLFNR